MTAIEHVQARQILDSRGNPTVEVDVRLVDGAFGRAAVPSGASTGNREAVEIRDGDRSRYQGKGVQTAVEAANGEIAQAVTGVDADEQLRIDRLLVELDGTPDKARLGANATLGVSLAVAKAAAASHHLPLYRYVGGANAHLLPMPMMNVINGGAHADNPLDFQEFMIAPVGATSMAEAVRIGSEVFHTLRGRLKADGHNTNVGDEGGFAPELTTADEALAYIVTAIEKAGYTPSTDVALLLDPAASEFYSDGAYVYAGEGRDDVFCTNVELLRAGIEQGIANSVLVKVNQIGTLSEMLDTTETAYRAGYSAVMSHRSGERSAAEPLRAAGGLMTAKADRFPATLSGDEKLHLPEFDDPPADPMPLVASWLAAADEAGVREPRAAVLATADERGRPSARVLLMKEATGAGLRFGFQSRSRKGHELAVNPFACATLYWRETLQQLTVTGPMERLGDHESDELFGERPRAARAATAASRQGQALSDEGCSRAAPGARAGSSPDRTPWPGPGYIASTTATQ